MRTPDGLPDDVPRCATPEQAALADWAGTPAAHARVLSVEATPDEDEVLVRVLLDGTPGFHDVDIVVCRRMPDGSWGTFGSAGGNSR